MKLIKLNGQSGFKKLNFLPFNRVFNVRQDLIESMNKYGFAVPILVLKSSLISGVEELYVLDGQNRSAAANFLNIPFYAIVLDVKIKTIPELVAFVATFNSTQKNWSPMDYVKAYAYLGYSEYKKLLKYHEESPFRLSTVAAMLTGIRSKGGAPKSVMNGTFKTYLNREFEYTHEIIAKASKFGRITARMGLAIHYVASLKYFDEEKFLKHFEKNYKIIAELKLDDFTDIFLSWIKY